MIIAKTPNDVRSTRFEGTIFNGMQYARTDYLGSDTSGYEAPQALLVEQSPNSTVPAHFHGIHQFQVVVKGGGMLGKHPVQAVSVHYAAGYTGYGPINSDDDGLFYFTLRANSEPGAFFLPEARKHQKKERRKNLMAEVPLRGTGTGMRQDHAVHTEPIIDRQEDGTAAWLKRMLPGEESLGPDSDEGGGQYYLVLDGGMEFEDRLLPTWSCVFVSSPDSPLQVRSGPSGLEVLILQFPRVAALRQDNFDAVYSENRVDGPS